jgi:hypothetical protein
MWGTIGKWAVKLALWAIQNPETVKGAVDAVKAAKEAKSGKAASAAK